MTQAHHPQVGKRSPTRPHVHKPPKINRAPPSYVNLDHYFKCACGRTSNKWVAPKFDNRPAKKAGSVSEKWHTRKRCAHSDCHRPFHPDAETVGKEEGIRLGGKLHGERRAVDKKKQKKRTPKKEDQNPEEEEEK